MKATGIVRKIDELGRVVLPRELRTTLGLNIKDPVEIYTEGDKIVFRKYQTSCVFCNADENLIPFNEKLLCKECLAKLKGLDIGD